jgi:integron integrase
MSQPQPTPRLMDQVRSSIRLRNLSKSTEETYAHWIRRFIVFHRMRHPLEMGEVELERFLSHLAQEQKASASSQNQALSAVLYLYKYVLDRPLKSHIHALRAKRSKHIPVVLAPSEIRLLFDRLSGTPLLIAKLLYGSGMRIDECLSLRIHQLDFHQPGIHIIDGKGLKDRIAMLPHSLIPDLAVHLVRVRRLHRNDLEHNGGYVVLPAQYHLKNPSASHDFRWQFVFPSTKELDAPAPGKRGRWHLHPDTFRRTLQQAANNAGLTKRISPHTLRHSFATQMLASGCNVRLLQSMLGHNSLKTTMVYAHLVEATRHLVSSPLDQLAISRRGGNSAA